MASTHPEPESAGKHELGRRTYLIAPVAPLDVDGVRTLQVGTALWLVVFIGLLPFYSVLQRDGDLWMLWTCLAGFGLGMVGWDHCRRRKSRREHEAQWDVDRARVESDPGGNPYDLLPSADLAQPPAPPGSGGGKRARRD